MQIRIASRQDADDVCGVHLSSFPGGEGEMVSKLAVDLLSEESTPPTISLIADVDGVAVGHVAFSPIAIDGKVNVQGYILAPLAVRPDYQKRSIGSRLVESGLQRLAAMGVGIVFVYGDPQYYGRFGFSAEAAEGFVPPYPLRFPFGWQGLVLRDGGGKGPPRKITCVPSLADPALW